MNLFFARACPEGCAFCYARNWLADGDGRWPEPARLLEPLAHYARLLRAAGPLPPWRADAPEAEALHRAAGVVNLLGGEPSLYPGLGALVRGLRELGLGVCLFTAGTCPERVREVAPELGWLTVNGRFAARAAGLGMPLERVSAQLPLRPGDDPTALLEAVAAAGLRSAILAFAAPAGGAEGPFFTPEDAVSLRAVIARVREAGRYLGVSLAWDCAVPRCLLPDEGAARCLPVPVLDEEGMVSACGGAYHHPARRPLHSFASLADLHAFTARLHRGIEARPHRLPGCAGCPRLRGDCEGMCLGWRADEEAG